MNWILKRCPDAEKVNCQKHFRVFCWFMTIFFGAIIYYNITIINASCYSKPAREQEIQQSYGFTHAHAVQGELFYIPQWAMGAYMQFSKLPIDNRKWVGYSLEQKKN